jgi:MtN3 and saliva related transmembrane protein
MLTDVLAVAAAGWGVMMGLSLVLQARKIVRNRSSRDVSLAYLAVLLVGFVLWLAYGIAIRNAALVVPNVVALTVCAGTIAIAARYRRPQESPSGRPAPRPEGRAADETLRAGRAGPGHPRLGEPRARRRAGR